MPAEAAGTTVAIVIDVLRATTTITCALHQGYERVLACGELDQARELAGRLGPGTMLAGERKCVRPEGFDLGNSPREFEGESPGGVKPGPDDHQRHTCDRGRRRATPTRS